MELYESLPEQKSRTVINPAPVVVGGCGGSGTRVVAEILARAGMHIGYDLNRSNDDLLFTYLFKHPYRFADIQLQSNSLVEQLLKIHHRMISGQLPKGLNNWGLYFKAGWDHMNKRVYYGSRWVFNRWKQIRKMKRPKHLTTWGWKEPHTIFFLPNIQNYYKNARFILVLRNGLDMAYTKNIQQMVCWGRRYQIDGSDLSPNNKFDYWYRSNQTTINLVKEHYSGNFLVLKLEDLWFEKDEKIKQLLVFAGLGSINPPAEIWNIPKIPASSGRYREQDTSWVDKGVLRKLAEFGYEKIWD
jgi:hypothetical protein